MQPLQRQHLDKIAGRGGGGVDRAFEQGVGVGLLGALRKDRWVKA